MKESVKKYVLDLVNAGLIGESKKVELAAMGLSRAMKKDDPGFSKSIHKSISYFAVSGSSSIRQVNNTPVPLDSDTQLEMATIHNPDLNINQPPVLSDEIYDRVNSFLAERNNIDKLLERSIIPSTSLLIIGQPGTGKTMLAKYIASKLNKDLVVLDLSASMSSLMGKTGANLKKVLQYAKRNAAVLLFDEFDAIAKKRDDNTDLGEIKRVVNVLLMELEEWPVSSVVIATSNHPELLDKAIWRRFDHVLNLSLPDSNDRYTILDKELGDFLIDSKTSTSILKPISGLFNDKSPADLCKFANNVKRRSVLQGEKPINVLFGEIEGFKEDKKLRGKFCAIAKEILGDEITVRELASITGLSPAGVQHHISKSK